MPTITVEARRSSEQRYRELLVSDFTKDTLNGTLALLWSVVGRSVPTDKGWRAVLEYSESGKTAPKAFHREIVERIRGFAALIHHPALPKMPDGFAEKKATRAAWLAERIWAYLGIRWRALLEGQYSFFRDIQSLLFLCAVHYLLPHLKTQGLHSEHSCLINGLFSHAVIEWYDDPAQQFYLLSVLLDYLEEHEESNKLLNQSFLLTPTDDHSYLTKGQSLWLAHLEAGQVAAAGRVLSHLRATAPAKYRSEIVEMERDRKTYGKRHGA